MKAYLACIAAGVSAATITQAQTSLVAGWDFSQFFGTGANSVDGATFNGAGNAEANFSDFFDPSPDVAAAAFGSIYYDGSFGSTDITPGAFNASTAPATGNLVSVQVQSGDGFPFNESLNNLVDSGQLFRQDLSLGIQTDSFLVFEADLSTVNSTGTDWTLTFAAKELVGSSLIAWEVSSDGSAYTALSGVTTTTSTIDTGYVISAGSILDGSTTAYFRADISGIPSQLLIDNVGISATTTVIPEPSAIGLFLGIGAFAFVARRRR